MRVFFILLISGIMSCMIVSAQATWHVKAIHPSGLLLDVKAIDKKGNIFDVKAFSEQINTQFMDVKAIINGKRIPVKVLISKDAYSPVKAIDDHGTIYDIKAITQDNQKLNVKGVSRHGHIVHIKAIGPDNVLYGVKAISPEGILHDIKGVKFLDTDKEGSIHNVDFFAHIKAMPQITCAQNDLIWHVKVIHPDGRFMDVKAFDKEGRAYEVNAIFDGDNNYIMDIKAFVGSQKIPLEILSSKDKYAPVKALSEDGTLYDIKAITSELKKLDIKGVSSDGNITHIKAIGKDGKHYGVKAVSPTGNFYDVKGISLESDEPNNAPVKIRAHVKAIVQL
jgi:hypothetical protein